MTDTKLRPQPGLTMALDYGPLVVFFLAYKFTDVFVGTLIFMAAVTAAVIISKLLLGRVSPMLWLSAILVVGFGGLTLYLHDERFIQIKPTVIYGLLSALLFAGVLTGRPLLKYLLEAAYEGLSERGWMLLSRNWAFWFAAMAVANEVLRATLSFDAWLTAKVWGVTIATLVFGAANVPMLMKHGLGDDPAPIPPEG
ncbi:MAG: septation protein IspZ [Sphingomonas sp.]|uniref:septation protein IspZ n=1 Tax=Sphingomonas sp. TaxID=28214 RepID=UPI0025FF4ACD|nr:septation protein IspZ [Sphingomonas sp.]MBY0282963.1 septation protein IspZ [Sphingomonas sp.]